MIHHADDWLTIYGGDCREVLATLPAESVHCVVTSPPFWGLRDYGTATWEGGGYICGGHDADMKPDPDWWAKSSDEIRAELEAEAAIPIVDDGCPTCGAPRCDHLGPPKATQAGFNERYFGRPSQESDKQAELRVPYKATCGKCGARRIDSQLGLEPTPEEYVANMVSVFREVRRVLRRDGTLWLNLGDSYFSHDPGGYRQGEFLNPDGRPPVKGEARNRAGNHVPGAKRKDLVGIPWRVAFALQADGWYLRSDIIWSKPNPMPESVTDRPTKSHEYLFLFAKSERYYFDADAVREDAGEWPGWEDKPKGSFNGKNGAAAFRAIRPNGRNIRSVWTIPTQPYPGAHFAVFPPKLVEPCIKAGCPEMGTVLDPFAGSGTTGLVAQRLSRRALLIDLNADYLAQQLERNAALPLGLVG